MLTSNVGEAYGFVRSRPDLDVPDLELIFAPAPFFDEGIGDPYDRHAVVMGPILVKPRSRGTHHAAIGGPAGQADHRSAVPQRRRGRGPRRLDLGTADERAKSPGHPPLSGRARRIARPIGATELDDETFEEAINACSQTLYHPVGTCRMGSDDASVVTPSFGCAVSTACGWPTPR